jgi:hypothetical protein
MGQARIGLLAAAGLTAALGLLGACAMPAGTAQTPARALPPPPPPKERLLAAIEANGCVLTAGNVEAILLRANLTQADLRVLTPELAAEGRAEVSGSGAIRVLTDNCI